MDDRVVLMDALEFHGHRCWASTMGVRVGLAALRALGAPRAGARSLHAIVEVGDYHGAACFADGVQYATGCTFGKGNIEKSGKGKLAATVIDKAAKRQVRVSYVPTLQPKIKESGFMRQRAAGVPGDEIPDADQWELVNLVWDAPEVDVIKIGPVEAAPWQEPEEVVAFAVCPRCHELVAESYVRVKAGEHVCLSCSGYPH